MRSPTTGEVSPAHYGFWTALTERSASVTRLWKDPQRGDAPAGVFLLPLQEARRSAEELSDPLRLDLLLEEAKAIVSDHHACSPNEALTRLCFVSWYTDRRLRDIASEVVTFAADRRGGFADQSTPRPFRFTL